MSAAVTEALRHLVACHRCQGADLAEPYTDPVQRDAAAIEHVSRTFHAVVITDLAANGPDAGAVLRYDLRPNSDAEMWATICAVPTCGRTVGGHPTGQLALADWREHKCTAWPR